MLDGQARKSRPAARSSMPNDGHGQCDRDPTSIALIAVMAEGHGPGRPPVTFAHLGGQPLYLWSLLALHTLCPAATLTLLAPASRTARVVSAVTADGRIAVRTVPVGEDRAEAYLGALYATLTGMPSSVSLVGLHDLAVPVGPPGVWAQALAEIADDDRAAVAAQLVNDTIKLASDDGTVYATPPRAELRALQTPLLAPRAALERALAHAGAGDPTSAGKAPASQWLSALVARLIAHDAARLRVVAAAPGTMPLRSRADLSLAGRWGDDVLSTPG